MANRLIETWRAVQKIWNRPVRRSIQGREFYVEDLARVAGELRKRYTGRSHYDAASANRLRDDWASTYDVPYSDISADLPKIIARSRREVDNNGIARAIVNSIVSNTVATGIRPQAQVKNKDGKPVETINNALEEGWERFSEQVDRSGKSTIYGMQSLALETIIVSGTVLLNRAPTPKKSWLRLAYQMVEPDRLDTQFDQQEITLTENEPTKQVLHGIGLDEFGKPTKYYLSGVEASISASNMRHIYRRKRPEQLIGVPWLHASLPDLWDYRQLKEDQLVKSRILADIALWLDPSKGPGFPGAGIQNSDDEYVWEPGTIARTRNKPEVIQAEGNLEQALKPLINRVLLDACSGAGVSYMGVSRDMENVNFAAARANLCEDRRMFRTVQDWFAFEFCQPIWNDFVYQMVVEDKIKGLPLDRFIADPWKYTRVSWQCEGWDWVDPQAEASAIVKMREAGLLTLKKQCAVNGEDWRDHIDQLAEEQTYAHGKSVVLNPTQQQPDSGVSENAEANTAEPAKQE